MISVIVPAYNAERTIEACLRFLTREKGITFGIMSTFVIFIDNIVMAAGITAGLASYTIDHYRRPHGKIYSQ